MTNQELRHLATCCLRLDKTWTPNVVFPPSLVGACDKTKYYTYRLSPSMCTIRPILILTMIIRTYIMASFSLFLILTPYRTCSKDCIPHLYPLPACEQRRSGSGIEKLRLLHHPLSDLRYVTSCLAQHSPVNVSRP